MNDVIKAWWQKVTAWLVAEVPAEMAACEFDCQELNCDVQQWQNCPHRRQKAAAINSLKQP